MARADELGWKVFGGITAIVAGLAARKAVEVAWKTTLRKDPPETPESPHHPWTDAAAWAVVSGVAVALARLVATRKAARVWARANGELPPSLDQPAAA